MARKALYCPFCDKYESTWSAICPICLRQTVSANAWANMTEAERTNWMSSQPLPPFRESEAFDTNEKYKKQFYDFDKEYREEVRQELAEEQERAKYTPKCPTCGCPDIEPISGISKAASFAMWGIFSGKIRKQFRCKNCGYEW